MSKRAWLAILLAAPSAMAAPTTVAATAPANPNVAAPAGTSAVKAAPAPGAAKPVPAGAAKPSAVAPALKTAPATTADPAQAALDRLALSIQRVTLENGLRVVLNVDNSSPTIGVSVTYDVGSRSEGPGQSGFAHLFEHMMFQGSRNVQKGQHFSLITSRGGNLNGTTSEDRTNYYDLLPATELELALFLEADRMRWLSITAENFENQRAVVKEEYRMRVDNAPYARASLRLGEIGFADYPPYAHPTIGSMQDLDAAKLEWVAAFYAAHYAPNNAVLTIAGDFEVDHALELVRKYFGPAERRQVPPFVEPPKAAPAAGPRREVVEDRNANAPGIMWGYRIPPLGNPDHYALELAGLILAEGESSRLYQKMVRDRAILQGVSANTKDLRGPDQFVLTGILTEKAKLADVEQTFQAELDRLAKTAPGADELKRAKAQVKHAFLFGLQSNARRAIQLGEHEVYFGDARLLTRELAAYLAVSADDVRRVAQQYLKPEAKFAIEVKPAAAKEGAK
jgi:zinc protease